MHFKNPNLTILYGSQTGNAQDISERIWRESKCYYFTGICKPMDDYNVTNLINENLIVFVCSTTGQGEEPDNMKNFWKFLLKRSLPSDFLTNLRFAVLGLGDSSYTKFNFAAKRLNKRLLQLGGQPLVSLGLGDDQHDLGYDAVVDPWLESLWKTLLGIHPLPAGVAPLDVNSFIQPRWYVSSCIQPSADINTDKSQSIYYPVRESSEFSVTVKENYRTTAENHFQDVRLIKLDTNGEVYYPGNVLVLRPKNLPSQVNAFKNILLESGVNIPPQTVVTVSRKPEGMPVPAVLNQKITFQQLCEEYFDLNAVPRRYTFNVLSQITDSDLEKEKCIEFTTAEGQDDLYSYTNRPRRNIVEVLQDFPHATKNLTLDMMFEIIPPIKPREFSIASSYKNSKNEIHILVAVVKYKTKLVKERLGLCSNYLANLMPGDQISVWLKKGTFQFPQDATSNVIMVGPGTGIAPFRSYVLERANEDGASAKNTVLFFGCRGQQLDFHCKSDFTRLVDEGKLTLVCAFSRDQENKIYVQHKISENADLVWKILHQKNSFVYVAGNSKLMPEQVKEALTDACVKGGGLSKDDAERLLLQMEKTKRYQIECWS